MRIERLDRPATDADPDLLIELVRQAFGNRRKMLRRSLDGRVTEAQFVAAGVASDARPEQLDVAAWGGWPRRWARDRGLTVVLSAPAKLTLSLRVVGVRARRPPPDRRRDGDRSTWRTPSRIDRGRRGRPSSVPTPRVSSPADDLVTRALALVGVTRRGGGRQADPQRGRAGRRVGRRRRHPALGGLDDLEARPRLGADVPFCVVGGRARVTGIGEGLEPLPHEDRTFTLLTPPLHCCHGGGLPRPGTTSGGPDGGERQRPGAGGAGRRAGPGAVAGRTRPKLTGAVPMLAGSGSTWFVEGSLPGVGRRVVHTLDSPLSQAR